MRICYISHSSSHFTRPYVDFFSKTGHEVHLVSLLGDDLPNAVNHHPAGSGFEYALRHLVYLRNLRQVKRIVRSLAPCVVHAHYLTSNGVLAAFSDGHPLVLSPRGSDMHMPRGPAHRAVLRYVLRRADLVNPVSRSFENKLLALGVPPGRMLTLTEGIETRRFVCDRSSREPGPIRLLCTRELSARYNVARIAEALSILRARGLLFQFTFAASGPDEGRLKRLAAERGIADSVRFLGGYTQDELPDILRRTDVYVSASPRDGASLSLLEAMASGPLPVVSDIEANREWLSGSGDGLFFDPADARSLAEALQVAMQDAGLRETAVERNRRTVERRGERARNLGLLAEAYEKLLDGHPH